MKYVLLLGFYITFLLPAQAQHVQHYSEQEGLSTRIVHHALRTSDGYLWAATNNGLNRFNGYEFLHFNKATTHKFISNFITNLFEDTNQVLWVATDNGICLFNLKSHQVIQVFQHNKNPNALSNNYVLQVYQSMDKTIWVTTADGVLHKYLGNGKFKQYANTLSPDGKFGYRLKVVEYKGKLWLKTQNRGVFCFDPVKENVLINYLTSHKSYDESGIVVTPSYGLICMVKEGIKVYDEKTNLFKPFQLGQLKDVFNVVPDNNGDLWVIAGERKKLFRITEGEIIEVTNYLFDFSQNVHINSIAIGGINDLWICTNNGLYKCINERPLFTHILSKEQMKKPFYVPSFRGMMQSRNGDVFMGGYGGLFKMQTNNTVTQLLDHKIPYSPNVLIDKDDKFLWMVSEGFGLLEVNKMSGQVIHHKRDPNRYNYLISGIQDNEGVFLLGGYDELVWYDPKRNEYTDCKLYFNGRYYNRPNVKFIFRSSKDEIWVCTNHGVFVLDKDRKVKTRYAEDEQPPCQIKVNQIYHISEDLQHRFWLSSNGDGVICVDADGKIIKNISAKNGLADNRVAFSICDSSNKLWIGTFNGLTVIDRNNKSNYYEEHGISSNEFNTSSLLYRKDGVLMMGSINGITVSDKKQLRLINKLNNDRIVISSIELLNDNNEIKQITYPEGIDSVVRLSYKSSYLAISFFNTDFRHADKNIFFYKLEGLYNNWIPLADKNYIRFATLAPGDYTLHVKGMSSSNTSEAKEALLSIHVEQVFYKRWWFITIAVFVLASFLFGIAYLRIQKIKDVLMVRAKISNDLHDDVGSVLTRVAMQAELLQEEVGKDQQATLNNIIKTCRTAMSNMRDVIWSSDVRYNNIGNLFDKITEMVQQTMEQSHIAYKLNYDEEVKSMKISPDNKQEIFFIMKEAFHNIVKHCKGDIVELNVYRVKDQLVFSVYNNGTVAQKQLQTSSGLNNMYMRATRIKANFTIDVTDGFLVKLIIPIKKKLF